MNSNYALEQLGHYKANKLAEEEAKRNSLASQYPLLFSQPNMKKYKQDRIAPTTKKALIAVSRGQTENISPNEETPKKVKSVKMRKISPTLKSNKKLKTPLKASTPNGGNKKIASIQSACESPGMPPQEGIQLGVMGRSSLYCQNTVSPIQNDEINMEEEQAFPVDAVVNDSESVNDIATVAGNNEEIPSTLHQISPQSTTETGVMDNDIGFSPLPIVRQSSVLLTPTPELYVMAIDTPPHWNNADMNDDHLSTIEVEKAVDQMHNDIKSEPIRRSFLLSSLRAFVNAFKSDVAEIEQKVEAILENEHNKESVTDVAGDGQCHFVSTDDAGIVSERSNEDIIDDFFTMRHEDIYEASSQSRLSSTNRELQDIRIDPECILPSYNSAVKKERNAHFLDHLPDSEDLRHDIIYNDQLASALVEGSPGCTVPTIEILNKTPINIKMESDQVVDVNFAHEDIYPDMFSVDLMMESMSQEDGPAIGADIVVDNNKKMMTLQEIKLHDIRYEIGLNFVKYCVNFELEQSQLQHVFRRYQEFEELNSRIAGSLSANPFIREAYSSTLLLVLPAKQAFPYIGMRWKEESFLEKRSKDLLIWLRELLELHRMLQREDCEEFAKTARGISHYISAFLKIH